MSNTKTVTVQIEVTQQSAFSSDQALHAWIALCLNCNTNNRQVVVTVNELGKETRYGPEVRDAAV